MFFARKRALISRVHCQTDSLMLLQLNIDAVLQLLLIVQPLTQMLMLGVQPKCDHTDKISSAIPSE